nr:MAG TPA: hypothetical protein [Caudoviricetes sp.]
MITLCKLVRRTMGGVSAEAPFNYITIILRWPTGPWVVYLNQKGEK